MIKKTNNLSIILLIGLFLLVVLLMTIGFSYYNQTLNFSGDSTLNPDGKMYISNISKVEMINATADPEYTENNIDFNLSFTTIDNESAIYRAVFDVTITNDSSYDYVFFVPNYIPRINRLSNSESIDNSYLSYVVSGISSNDKILSNTNKTFTVTLTFTNPLIRDFDTFVIDGDFAPILSEDISSHIFGSVGDSQVGDLTGSNTSAVFNIDVINTYSTAKTFSLSTSDEGFVIKGANSTSDPTYTIAANSEETFQFSVLKANGSEYASNTKRINIFLSPQGLSTSNSGIVSVSVDRTLYYEDVTSPIISNVSYTINDTPKIVSLSWSGTDDSSVSNYIIYILNNSNSKVGEITTPNFNTQATIDLLDFSLSDGNYYFVVGGVDEYGNAPTSAQMLSATTNSGIASRTSLVNCRWTFNITYNTENINHAADSTIERGGTHSETLTAPQYYNLPTSLTITMGGSSSNVDYTYTSNNGSLVIRNITGDIEISGSSTYECLVEETKILLANGQYKNIEDITYTDLLKVYDHVAGKTTNVYPIWIEKSGTSNIYEKITFSDGSTLKTVNEHSLFNVDLNRYVKVTDPNEFNIGTNVYKIENDELKIVHVVNIEYIEDTVKYYNVVSTKYYNIIANDFLSTDSTSSISNIYGYKENAKYSDNYYSISNGEKLKYDYISTLPYYLYEGLNLQNGISLINNGIDVNFLNNFVQSNTLPIISRNNKNYFIVTTSLDEVNSNTSENYLYEEGSIYKLPRFGANYFIETSTNKRYEPGAFVKITNSIHFEAF